MESHRPHLPVDEKNDATRKVHEALRSCAENSSHARKILNDLFVFKDLEDLEMIRYLMIELCVSVFHGLTPPEPPRIASTSSQYQRQSKLGTVNLPPLSSIADPEGTGPYVYDEYSDESNDDDNYSSYSNEKTPYERNQSTAEEQWAQALSQDHQPHSPEQQVTCEDLFNALATNLSSVVLPKVPIFPSTISNSSSSSTPSVVSTSPSVPSRIPYSINSNQSPSQSLNSSLRSSPTDPSQIFDQRDFEDKQDTLRSLSNNGEEEEEDDLRSVDTIEAAHSQQLHATTNTVSPPSTPPSVRPTRFHDHGKTKTKSKSSHKIVHIRGPTRLRNLIENAVKEVIQECDFENSCTPQKHSTSLHGKHSHSLSLRAEGGAGTPLRLTNPILKRITRSVSIELSLELSANNFTASDHLNYPQQAAAALERPQQASPAARDLSNILWPAISGFVGTEVTPEMIGVFVDLIEADVIDKKIFPDLYIDQIEEIPQRGQGGRVLFMDGEEEVDDEQEGRRTQGAQDVIISQYVKDIDLSQGNEWRRYHEEENEVGEEDTHQANKRSSTRRAHHRKRNQSASRQILDLDGDFDEETSANANAQFSRKYFQTERSTPIKREKVQAPAVPPAAWDSPVSPMDHLFRQTVGALGSARKLPYIPDEERGEYEEDLMGVMNDSSSGDVSPRDEFEGSVDHLLSQEEVYRGLHDSDYDSDSPSERPSRHEDTEFVDSYRAAEEEILGIRSRRASASSSSASSASANDSNVPDASLQPQRDTEDSFVDDGDEDDNENGEDEDYISISDLPPDFGQDNLSPPSHSSQPASHHELNGVYHIEPALSEDDLEALERQLNQLNSSQSSQLFSQPSIAEIIVGEDNLIVLPRGESPVSSPDVRFVGNSREMQKRGQGGSNGSPKYRNHISSTSSDSEESDEGERDGNGDKDRFNVEAQDEGKENEDDREEDSLENISRLRPPRPSSSTPTQHSQFHGLAENIQIDTLLSEDTEDLISNRQNWISYSGSYPSHIPPSPFIDEGFKNQIPYPKAMNGLSPSSTIDFQAIPLSSTESNEENGEGMRRGGSSNEEEEDFEEEEGEEGEEEELDEYGEEIEPRHLDHSFMIPSPQRHLPPPVTTTATATATATAPLNDLSSSSSSGDELHKDDNGNEEDEDDTPQRVTSEDEREEDRRLFDAIMSDKPSLPPPPSTTATVRATASSKRNVAPIDIIPGAASPPLPPPEEFPAPTEEEMQEYFAEMMRNALHGINHFVVGSHNPSSSSAPAPASSSGGGGGARGRSGHQSQAPVAAADLSESQLQEISAQAIESMDKRFQNLFAKHFPKTSLSSSVPVTLPSDATAVTHSSTAAMAERRIVEMEERVVDYHSKKTKTVKAVKKSSSSNRESHSGSRESHSGSRESHSGSRESHSGSRESKKTRMMSAPGEEEVESEEAVLTPEEYLQQAIASASASSGRSYPDPTEYQKRLSQILGTSAAPAPRHGPPSARSSVRDSFKGHSVSLPVTGNEELNQMFTQSFRELVSYYQTNGTGEGDDDLPLPPPPPSIEVQEPHPHHSKAKSSSSSSSRSHSKPRKTAAAAAAAAAEGDRVEEMVQVTMTSPKVERTKVKITTHERSKRGTVMEESELDLGEAGAAGAGAGGGAAGGTRERGQEMTRMKAKRESNKGTKESKGMMQGRHHEDITAATDYSKHLHGNQLTTGRVVYGLHNEGAAMAQEWNTTNTRPTRRKPRSLSPSGAAASASAPSSPPHGQHRRPHSNSSAGAKSKQSGFSMSTSASAVSASPGKRDQASRRSSSAPRHSRAATGGGTAGSRFQHLSAPTFSSVVRSLNIAGIDYNEVQAIAQASKDANFLISSHHADLSSPAYADSYYSSGIDIISALAAASASAGHGGGSGQGQGQGSSGHRKKKRQGKVQQW